jgi:hypothetical protein
MPPETEVVPPHPSSVPPPVRAVTLNVQGGQKGMMGVAPGSRPSADSTLAARSAAPFKSAVATIDETHSYPSYVDPEKRARGELNCLRDDPGARQAFYEDLRRTVERVRAGEKDAVSGEKKAPTCGP